jgi:hypothetical protein
MNVSLLKESKLFSSSSDRKNRSGSGSAAAARSTRRISSSVISAAAAAAAAHLSEDCPAPIQEEDDGRPKETLARSKNRNTNKQISNVLFEKSSLSSSSCLVHTIFASTLV